MIIDDLKEKYQSSTVPDSIHTWNRISGISINEFNDVLEQLRPYVELADWIKNSMSFNENLYYTFYVTNELQVIFNKIKEMENELYY